MKSILPALLFAGFALSACAATPLPTNATTDPAALTGRHWSLVELNGISVAAGAREPYIQFDAGEMRYSGSGGCNGMGGGYELKPGNHIHFSQGMHTMMACQTGMDTEAAFSVALEKADSYAISGNTMTLGADGRALARFETK